MYVQKLRQIYKLYVNKFFYAFKNSFTSVLCPPNTSSMMLLESVYGAFAV